MLGLIKQSNNQMSLSVFHLIVSSEQVNFG